jgi:hypothetical protein
MHNGHGTPVLDTRKYEPIDSHSQAADNQWPMTPLFVTQSISTGHFALTTEQTNVSRLRHLFRREGSRYTLERSFGKVLII